MFDPLPKAAYTHGLELIYTLQDVDINSVRVFSTSQTPEVITKKSIVPFPLVHSMEEQLELAFGGIYSKSITPFIAQEPIQVLGLSRQAEKALLDHSKTILMDISYEGLKGLGIGQGHVDEAVHKLELYLDGRTLDYTFQVDFSSWIRSLVLLADRKKAYVALEAFELQDLITLLPSEGVEVRRLTPDKKAIWTKEFLQQMRSPALTQRFVEDFGKVAEVFLKPWIQGRLGLASKNELSERWERIGDNLNFARAALQLFEFIYGEEEIFSQQLYMIDSALYTNCQQTAQDYQEVVDLAETYMTSSSPEFNLEHLVSLMSSEFALIWRSFPEGFICKAIQLSPKFLIFRDLYSNTLVAKVL